MAYTDEELETMLANTESDLVERKESLNGDTATSIRETICAFANDLPGHQTDGVIFVGARDDGTLTNLTITDQVLVQLGGMKDDGNIVPPPTMSVSKRRLKGADTAVVTVTPSDSPPVRYRGRIWIRTGPRRTLASAQDERILSERRRHGDRPFDARPVRSSTVADLGLAYFQETYLPAAFNRDVLDANDRTIEQRLMATKMVTADEPPIPTGLGILALCNHGTDFLPGAYVQFLRLNGDSLSAPIVDAQAISGRLEDVVRRIDEKFNAHNFIAVDIVSSSIEKRQSLYPLAALQQVARNAILHRSYEGTHSPVRISWFSDRVEIISPGGPFGSISAVNFGTPGMTDYRNPNLAEAMRVLGFIQRFGAGIPTARTALEENGNPPLEFRIEPTFVTVVLRPRR